MANKSSSPKDSEKNILEKPEAKCRDPREKEDSLSHVLDKVKKLPAYEIFQSVLKEIPRFEFSHDGRNLKFEYGSNDNSSGLSDLDNPFKDFQQHMQTEDPAIQQARGPSLGYDEDLDKSENPLHHMRTKTTIRHARGLVVGCSGAGKTRLLYSLMGKSLKEIKEIESTRGLQVNKHTFTVTDDGDFLATENLHRDFLARVPKSMLTKKKDTSEDFDDTDNHPFIAWTNDIPKKEYSMDIPTIPDGKGKAKVDETISIEVIKKILDAKENGINVSMIDFSGQFADYACHQFYIRSSAFYILVMDMAKIFEEDDIGEEEQNGCVFTTWKYKGYIEFWLNYIKMLGATAAPILIVATCTHTEGKTEDEIEDYRKCFWSSLSDREWLNENIRENIYTFELINRHEGERSHELQSLKNTLVKIVSKELYTEIPVPSSWALLEHRLLDTGKPIMSYEEIKKMNRDVPKEFRLESDKEIFSFLEFFHKLGIVLYFNGDATHEHTILDLQWFSDGFSRLIADKKHINKDCRQWHVKEWEFFYQTGQMNSTFVDALWREEEADVEKTRSYMKYKYELIAYMERLQMLVCTGETGEGQSWYVPCMNKKPFIKDTIKEDVPRSSILCFRFTSFALFVFYRLIAYCMSSLKWKMASDEQDRCLFQTAGVFKYRKHVVVLGICDEDIQLQVISLELKTLRKEVSREVGYLIHKAIEELTQTFKNTNMNFLRGYKCQKKFSDHNNPSFIPVEVCTSDMKTVTCRWCPIEEHEIRVDKIQKYWEEKKSSYGGKSNVDLKMEMRIAPQDTQPKPGEEFKKPEDDSFPFEHTEILGKYEIGKLIGRIQLKEGSCSVGTGFKVGSKYVMTAFHVMRNNLRIFWREVRKMLTEEESREIEWKEEVPVTGYWNISNFIPSLAIDPFRKEKLKRLEESLIELYEIKFEFLKEATGKIAKFKHNIAFASPEHDVLILELAEQEDSDPKSFSLLVDDFCKGKLHVFGHPHGKPLQHDPACTIIKDEKELSTLRKKGTNFFKEVLPNKKHQIEDDYASCVISDEKVFFHSSNTTAHGASGAPLTIVHKEIPKVYGMLLMGHPKIFYNSPIKIKKHHLTLLVESGISMKKVRSLLESSVPELEQELFRDM